MNDIEEVAVTDELRESTQHVGTIEGVEIQRERDEPRFGWWYTAARRVGDKSIALRAFVPDPSLQRIGGLADAKAVCALVEAVLRCAREHF